MKNSNLGFSTIAFVVAFIAARAGAEESCAKVASLTGTDCASLKVQLDVSACGGEKKKSYAAHVGSCSENGAEFYIQTAASRYEGLVLSETNEGKKGYKLSGDVKRIMGRGSEKSAKAELAPEVVEKAENTPEKKVKKPKDKAIAEKEALAVANVAASSPAKTPVTENTAGPKAPEVIAAPPPPAPPVAALPAPPPTAPVIVPYGDIRYRHENLYVEGAGLSSYDQHRIRARLGLKANVGDGMLADLRLASGPGRVSTNQTLGDANNGFANYTITLDRASFSYAPCPVLKLSGGRIANPFFAAGDSDLVWDADLNFDGLALNASGKAGPVTLSLNPGFFWIHKSTAAGTKDVKLYSVQGVVKAPIKDSLEVAASAAYHAYQNIRNSRVIASATNASGNSSLPSGTNRVYTGDFHVLDTGLEFKGKVVGVPVSFYGNYARNLAKSDATTAYLLGLRFNRLKEKGDWTVAYDYRSLQRDAVIGAFADGDSFGGGTNGRGHRLGAAYQFGVNWNLAATGFLGKSGIYTGQTSLKRNRAQLDLNVKF